MCTSDERKRKKARKATIAYLCLTVFCGLFSAVYEYFSHGVYSGYMVFLFLFPLLGGVVPFAAMYLLRALRFPVRLSLNLYNSGVATLAVGSCFQGVLEIYGTTSELAPAYEFVGIALVVAGILAYFLGPRIAERVGE